MLSHVSFFVFFTGIDYLHEDLRHSYVSLFSFCLTEKKKTSCFERWYLCIRSTIFSKSTNISDSITKRDWKMILGLFFRMQKPVMILAAMILTLILATQTPGSIGKSESKDNEKFIPRIRFNVG